MFRTAGVQPIVIFVQNGSPSLLLATSTLVGAGAGRIVLEPVVRLSQNVLYARGHRCSTGCIEHSCNVLVCELIVAWGCIYARIQNLLRCLAAEVKDRIAIIGSGPYHTRLASPITLRPHTALRRRALRRDATHPCRLGLRTS